MSIEWILQPELARQNRGSGSPTLRQRKLHGLREPVAQTVDKGTGEPTAQEKDAGSVLVIERCEGRATIECR